MADDEYQTESDDQTATAQTNEQSPVVLPTQPENELPTRESDAEWRAERLELARPDETQRGALRQNGGARPGEGALQDDPREIRTLGDDADEEVIVDLERLRAWKRRVYLGGPRGADWEEFDQIVAGIDREAEAREARQHAAEQEAARYEAARQERESATP